MEITGPAHSEVTTSPRCWVTRKPLPSRAWAAVLPSATTIRGFTSRMVPFAQGDIVTTVVPYAPFATSQNVSSSRLSSSPSSSIGMPSAGSIRMVRALE